MHLYLMIIYSIHKDYFATLNFKCTCIYLSGDALQCLVHYGMISAHCIDYDTDRGNHT